VAMKINLAGMETRKQYQAFVYSIVNSYLHDQEEADRDKAVDEIFDKLARIRTIQSQPIPRTIKAIVYRVATRHCFSCLRKLLAKRRHMGEVYKIYRRKSRPDFQELKESLEAFGFNKIKNLDIFEYWCHGFPSRRKIAKKFHLTEQQTKAKLQYMRKKIRALLNQTKESLSRPTK
jgi:DNA-directed RNA polymerase specialized sigma24 family protein